MPKTRPYFHDRLVLLLLTINSFLLLVCLVVAFLPLLDSGGAVISEYRANLGLDGYRAGSRLDIASFGVFAAIAYVFHLLASIKLYHIRKNASLVVLMLTCVLLIFTLVVTNALLELR